MLEILEDYFTLDLEDAQEALSVYRRFDEQTNQQAPATDAPLHHRNWCSPVCSVQIKLYKLGRELPGGYQLESLPQLKKLSDQAALLLHCLRRDTYCSLPPAMGNRSRSRRYSSLWPIFHPTLPSWYRRPQNAQIQHHNTQPAACLQIHTAHTVCAGCSMASPLQQPCRRCDCTVQVIPTLTDYIKQLEDAEGSLVRMRM